MPILNNRHNHVKVYRPRGTKTAEGKAAFYTGSYQFEQRKSAVECAFRRAWRNFISEHGRLPELENDVVVFEGTISHGVVQFTILTLPEEGGT
jgi:hypothetical protein